MSILISGATGFVALHTIDLLLQKGYKVIGTVRSAAKGDKLVLDFKARYPSAQLSYQIVGDISADGAFDQALKNTADEVEYVLHTASPFSFGFNQDNEDAYLKPAVNGTVNMLKGIKANAPKVKAVVVTSSFVAVMNLMEPSLVHTEETWNPLTWDQAKDNEAYAYSASKKYAEQAAWDFVKNEKPNFTLTTLTPPYIFGPQTFEESLALGTLNTSAEILNSMLKTTPAQDGTVFEGNTILAADVRDVAKFHLLPLTDPAKYNGKRLFVVSSAFSEQKILNIIHKNFPQLDGKISRGVPEAEAELDSKLAKYDNSKTVALTGETFIPFEKTVVDSIKQILDYQKK